MPTPKKRYLDSTPAITKQRLAKTKSGIPVTYFTQSDAMSLLADNPNRTAVLDEVIVRPYNKLPMQSELFRGITNQAANEKADEYVNRVTPTAEDLLNIGTLGGLNNLSPTQWTRRAYDLREAIKGNMSWNKFGNNWFYGNNGLVSDKYAQEHPYASAAINLVGDIGAVGTFSALRKLPKYASLMKAENMAAQEATALKWRDMLSNSVKRTRLGDVEVDNPLLNYRQGDASMGADFLNTGIVSIKNGSYDNPMFAQGKLFYGSPFETPSLLNPSLGATKGTKSGRVFLLRKPKDMTAKSDLLVSDVDMANANKDSHIISPYARELDENGNVIVTKVNEDIRRVPFAEKPATSKNTTLYRWKPNYGYKKVSVPKSTYVVGKEIVDDAGNLNINVDDLLKQIKTEYPYTLNPEDLINKGINGSTDLSEHLQAVVKSAQEYPLPKGVSRKEFVTTALYHDLGKVFGDFGHGTNSTVIASELNLPITRNAIKAVSSHMNQQKYFETATQLEKALHAADVGRGMKYKTLIEKYPYLKYDTRYGLYNKKPNKNKNIR